MSTRGLVGFVVDGQVKASYNHFDSYPTGLGEAVVKFIEAHRRDEGLKEKVAAIRLVDENQPPTPEDVAHFASVTDLEVSAQSTDDWYCLLRNAQGDLEAYLKLGAMPDNSSFAEDSLFCEWGYLVNLDELTLEVYRGFQKEPATGRFGPGKPQHDYYPITLYGTYSWSPLPDMQTIESAVYGADEEEESA